MKLLVSITNYILVIVDFCFINIEGELIIRLSEAIELFKLTGNIYDFMSVFK